MKKIYNIVPKQGSENEEISLIIYNGKCFGEWNDNSNIDYPEDLTLCRELAELIDIGIEIGKTINQAPTGEKK